MKTVHPIWKSALALALILCMSLCMHTALAEEPEALSVRVAADIGSIFDGATVGWTVMISGGTAPYDVEVRWLAESDLGLDTELDRKTIYSTEETILTFETRFSLENNYTYVEVDVRVDDSAGNSEDTWTTLRISSGSPVAFHYQPNSMKVQAGDPFQFKAEINQTSDIYDFYWYVKRPGESSFTDATDTGYSISTYIDPSVDRKFSALQGTAREEDDGLQVYCVVKGGGANNMQSMPVTLTVASKPKITAQPAAESVMEGDTAAFAVEASGANLSYQWQYSTDGSTWVNCGESGSTDASFSFDAPADRNGWYYRCIVENSAGSVTSEAALLTVKAKPVLTAQPKAQTVNEDKNATFKVTATGEGLSYQWQYSKDGKSWADCTDTGCKTATCNVKATVEKNGWQFRCMVKNEAGSVTSAAAKLTVKGKPVLTAQPAAQSVKEGEKATFTVTATGSALSYQWQYSKDGKSWADCTDTGCKTATCNVKATAEKNGWQFRCVVKNEAGSVTSAAAKLTVKAAFTRLPGDVTGDGKVNIMDVIRLLKKVSGWTVEVVQENSDVTGDGNINIMDVIRLLKKVSGWEVELK